MTTKDAEVILDSIDVVKLDIHLWTSSKKLRKEDLLLASGSKLPPEELAHLGTKKTIDPEKLKGFTRIKKEAERICLENGTRFIGGFANPKTEIPAITAQLDALAKEFYQEREAFLAVYEQETQAWMDRHPEFKSAIQRAIEPSASVAAKLRFDYVIFHVSKSEVSPNENSLERKALGMSDQLFHEIAMDANELVERSFVGKDSVTARVLNAFRRMRNKLNSLAFLDHRCMPVVDEIDKVLETMPKAGPFNGSAFNDLFRLALLLSDEGKIKRHGGGLLIEPSDGEGAGVEEDDMIEIPTSKPDADAQAQTTSQLDGVSPSYDDFEAFFENYPSQLQVIGDIHENTETDSSFGQAEMFDEDRNQPSAFTENAGVTDDENLFDSAENPENLKKLSTGIFDFWI